jgi:hypothetical protein
MRKLTLPCIWPWLLTSPIILIAWNSTAQCNSQDGGWTCEEAPLVCLHHLCDFTEPNFPDAPHNGWCGNNTAIHNPQYFQFFAIAETVLFEISVVDCWGGQNALQAAIMQNCPWDNDDVLDCNPGTPEGGSFILQPSGMVIGQPYWLVIDGSASAQCEYTIEQATGIYEPTIITELDDVFANPEEVCQGYNSLQLIASPRAEGVHGYWWFPEWAPDDTIATTDPEVTIDVPTWVDSGIYQICVQPFSGCDTSDVQTCTDILVLPRPALGIKDTVKRCQDEYPFTWNGVIINAPGTYWTTRYSPDGCPLDSMWTILPIDSLPITGLSVVAGPCGSDSTFMASIHLDYAQGDTSEFDLLIENDIIGQYALEDFPVVIPHFPGNPAGNYTVSICRPGSASPDCCLSVSFDGPPCPEISCAIDSVVLTATPCIEGWLFDFIVDIDPVRPGAEGFSIVCNGDLYGPFGYSEAPVRIGPFVADSSSYTVLIFDNADPSCNITVTSEAIECTTAFPDPQAAGLLRIAGNGSIPIIYALQDIRIAVFAADGRNVIPAQVISAPGQYSLATLPPGLYFGYIQYGGHTYPMRLVRTDP